MTGRTVRPICRAGMTLDPILPRRPVLLGLGALSLPRIGRAQAPLDAALQGAASLPRLHAVNVAQDGATLAERRLRGPAIEAAVNIKSASKSLLSVLVGCAIERGVLRGLDQPVAPILRASIPGGTDPRVEAITIGNLLTMRAGLERTSGPNFGAWASSPDPVRYALTRPFLDDPGTAMGYSTGATHVLGAALSHAAGRPLLDLMRDWLGEPLGIAIPPWIRDPQGRYIGGNDMRLAPRALLRVGEMMRAGGVYAGRRVVSADWVRESWTPRTRSPWSGQLYGYGWWIAVASGHPVSFAWGYGGQMLYVVPDMRLTVVMTSDPNAPRDPVHMAGLHGLMADGIMPALGAVRTEGSERLAVPEG
ncbi:serine hydrolase domain-containing protein [Muricoccus radiodurans]|uniref:serine hydrolase domain-containing protein n=1 Tax=Muricoccus radiodurans TaxID=2231721 RepID=UPI003CF905F3